MLIGRPIERTLAVVGLPSATPVRSSRSTTRWRSFPPTRC